MKWLFRLVIIFICCNNAYSDDMVNRVSLFSTSTDWSAVTGLHWGQYDGVFTNTTDVVKSGMVLYYLDGFPCYGEADSVRIWLGPSNKQNGKLRLVCVHSPKIIKFAWRYATEDAPQTKTTGIIQCNIDGERHFKIDVSKCDFGSKWSDYK